MHGNGTHEDDVFTRNWINKTLNDSPLTEDQIKLKEFILSNQELTVKVFGTMFIQEINNVGEVEDYQSGKKLLKHNSSQVSLYLDIASSKPLSVHEQTMESMKNDELDPDNYNYRHGLNSDEHHPDHHHDHHE